MTYCSRGFGSRPLADCRAGDQRALAAARIGRYDGAGQ